MTLLKKATLLACAALSLTTAHASSQAVDFEAHAGGYYIAHVDTVSAFDDGSHHLYFNGLPNGLYDFSFSLSAQGVRLESATLNDLAVAVDSFEVAPGRLISFAGVMGSETANPVTINLIGARVGKVSLFSGEPTALMVPLRVAAPPAVPVPEPTTYTLMLAGLAGIGVFAKRRARRT